MVGNINVYIGSIFFLVFFGVLPSWKGMFVDFVFNFLGGIGKENGRVRVCGTHFWFSSLERGEEFTVNTSGFRLFDSGAHISCHSEIGVLVNTLGNQTWNYFISENMFERTRKSGGSLNGGVGHFPDDIWLVNSENSFQLIVSDAFLKFANIHVHMSYIFTV